MAGSPPPNCKVLQANLHHSITATAQTRKWLEVNNTAVALIQEPWISRGRICGLSNLGGKLITGMYLDKPRTCIYVSKNIQAQPLTEFCSRDVCAIKLLADIGSGLPEVVMASAYMPEEDDPPPHDLTRLISDCESKGLDLLVAADSNSHHQLWGMSRCNGRGKKLVEYLFSTNLNILNIRDQKKQNNN